jgi:hypothetical protein
MTFLYRHFDGNGKLLYIGISLYPLLRTAQHAHYSLWMERVSKITLQKIADRNEAEKIERKAILDENPEFNIRRTGAARGKSAFIAASDWDYVPPDPTKPSATFDEVVAFFGSESALAKAIGAQQSTVMRWRTVKGKRIPELWSCYLYFKSCGKLNFNRDDYPPSARWLARHKQ